MVLNQWENILESLLSTYLTWGCIPFLHVAFNLSCVYGCLLSCVSCCNCLGFIVVVLLYYGCIVTIIAVYVLIAVYVRTAVVL
jgi:hypothetical protein